MLREFDGKLDFNENIEKRELILKSLLNLLKKQELPDRVMIEAFASATPRIALDHGIVYDLVFLRKDGWMLGAPDEWAEHAMKMWHDDWAAVLDVRTEELKLYDEFVRERSEQDEG